MSATSHVGLFVYRGRGSRILVAPTKKGVDLDGSDDEQEKENPFADQNDEAIPSFEGFKDRARKVVRTTQIPSVSAQIHSEPFIFLCEPFFHVGTFSFLVDTF